MTHSSLNRVSKLLTGLLLVLSLSNASTAGAPKATNNKPIFKLFIARSPGPAFQKMQEDITQELKDYPIKNLIVDDKTNFDSFSKEIDDEKPDFLIAMDNRSVDFAKRWNEKSPKKLPGLGLMALNLSSILKGNTNLAGITFESPAYTLVTQFRYFADLQIKTVLVFYRKSIFSEIIEIARQQLQQENINLVAIDVEQDGKSKQDIEKFITTKVDSYLSEPEKYDVVWSMLDSVLLSKDIFINYWIPVARKTKIPFLTGTENLVSTSLDFASFAVTPNMQDLATQAVQVIQRILEEKEKPSAVGVQQVISVNKVLNKKKTQELGIKLKQDHLSDLKVLEE